MDKNIDIYTLYSNNYQAYTVMYAIILYFDNESKKKNLSLILCKT